MKNISIKDFDSSDLSSAIEIIRSNTPKYFSLHEEQEFIDYLENNIELYHVYILEGRILACSGINFSDDQKEAFMSWGMVHSDFHGKGIGKIMTKYRLDLLKSRRDLEKIILKTSQKTDGFYEKLGFEVVMRQKDFWAKGLDLVQMEYNLDTDR